MNGRFSRLLIAVLLLVQLWVPGAGVSLANSSNHVEKPVASDQISKINSYLNISLHKGAEMASRSLQSKDKATQRYAVEVLRLFGAKDHIAPLREMSEKTADVALRRLSEIAVTEIVLRETTDVSKLAHYIDQHVNDENEDQQVLLIQKYEELIAAHPDDKKLKEMKLEHRKRLEGHKPSKAQNKTKEQLPQRVVRGESWAMSLEEMIKDSDIKVKIVLISNPDQVFIQDEMKKGAEDTMYVWQTDDQTPVGLYKVLFLDGSTKKNREEESFFVFIAAEQESSPEVITIETDNYEPNNTMETAYQAYTARTYQSYISTETDADYFKFTAGQNGTIKVNLTHPADVDYDLWVYDSAGNDVCPNWEIADNFEELTCRVFANQKYFVHVLGWQGFDAANPYTLKINSIAAVTDNYEPNEDIERAYLIKTGTSLSSYISISEDQDTYKFALPIDSTVLVTLKSPTGKNYDLDIYDSQGNYITGTGSIDSIERVLVGGKAGDTLYVQIRGNDGSVDFGSGAYTLTVGTPVKDTFEYNSHSRYPYGISPGSSYLSYISMTDDYDYYTFTAKYSGKMTVSLGVPAGKDYDVSVYDDRWERVGAGFNDTLGGQEQVEFSVEANQTYYVFLDGYGSYSSTAPYTLQLSKYSVESYEPNDTLDTAYDIELKKVYKSYLISESDIDLYRFTPTFTGRNHLTLKVPQGQNYDVSIFDSNQAEIASGTLGTDLAEEVEFRVLAGQTYYAKITGATGDFSTSSPYVFCISPIKYEYSYDSANRLQSVTFQKGTHLDQLLFTYDKNGNLTNRSYLFTELSD